jgi:hypothetical protein
LDNIVFVLVGFIKIFRDHYSTISKVLREHCFR